MCGIIGYTGSWPARQIISKMADYVLDVPETLPVFSGLLAVIPLPAPVVPYRCPQGM